MPNTYPLPDYPILVYGEPNQRRRIAVGSGPVFVDGQEYEAGDVVVVDEAVHVSGKGAYVTTEITDEKVSKRGKRK